MSHPELALAVHKQKGGHGVTWAELDDGRILQTGSGLSYSEDGGLTWGERFIPRDETGADLKAGAPSMVRLDNGAIGIAYTMKPVDAENRYDMQTYFRRSEDGGRTWSAPVRINANGPSVQALQDVLLRTSSGRLIFPAYGALGKGNFHYEKAPFAGGYVNGNFVSTDAHFFDPHFGYGVVFYSDDEGKTWQRNRDGEIHIIMGNADRFEPVYEPSVAEVAPGKLLMVCRTRLNRYFQVWSYDNGETWTRPQPMQLGGVHVPAQVRTFPETGHLLCVFTQHSVEEIRRGYVRQRLSSAVSRNGGGVWEHFQNVESMLPGTHVEPGPTERVRPEQCYSMGELRAPDNDPRYCEPLPVGYGRWCYPSVLVLKDRVLISHTYGQYDETGTYQNEYNSRLKVLPTKWFYGGQEPARSSPILDKLTELAPQP